MKLAKGIAEEQVLAIEAGDDCFVMTAEGHRITDEGGWRLESIIAAKLSPILNLLVNSKLHTNPAHAAELVDKAIEMLSEEA